MTDCASRDARNGSIFCSTASPVCQPAGRDAPSARTFAANRSYKSCGAEPGLSTSHLSRIRLTYSALHNSLLFHNAVQVSLYHSRERRRRRCRSCMCRFALTTRPCPPLILCSQPAGILDVAAAVDASSTTANATLTTALTTDTFTASKVLQSFMKGR